MSDDLLATILILVSAVIHAGMSALIKTSEDKYARRASMLMVSGCIALPFVFFVPFPTPEVWVLLIVGRAIHLGFEFCLINAYRFGDLSQVYPVFRGTAPVLTAVGAYVFLSESLSWLEILALLMLALGILSFAIERHTSLASVGTNRQALLFALATSVFIALYTLIDATGVRTVDQPLTYISWTFVMAGLAFPATVAIWRPGTLRAHFRDHARTVLFAGSLVVATYSLALFAYNLGQTAEIAALRETSVVFAAIIGVVFLGERFGRRRILAAIVIAASAVALKVV
jgi:drug/metabolite transporter (DMT)-like permease